MNVSMAGAEVAARLRGAFARGVDGRSGARPMRRDWVLVAVLSCVVIVEVVIEPVVSDDIGPAWSYARLLPAGIALVLVVWRRVMPLVAVLVAFGTEAIYAAVSYSSDVESTLGHGLAGVVLVYALFRWAPPAHVAIGGVFAAVVVVSAELLIGTSLALSFGVLVPWAVVVLAALAMRYRSRLKEQETLRVRLEERHELARELHDTVAHHVSAIAVQAQAAQYVVTNDPGAAADAMRSVESIASTALDEMRRMVGILRSDDDRERTVAATSLADLADPDGTPCVSIVGSTDLRELSTPVATAVFRIAQESITNARRHSRDVTFVDLVLSIEDDHVSLSVVNDGVPTLRNAGSGYGLIGMRERVEALGGTLHTGPRPAAGWSVDVTIPRRRRADEANR